MIVQRRFDESRRHALISEIVNWPHSWLVEYSRSAAPHSLSLPPSIVNQFIANATLPNRFENNDDFYSTIKPYNNLEIFEMVR